jgi:hypothetical protein
MFLHVLDWNVKKNEFYPDYWGCPAAFSKPLILYCGFAQIKGRKGKKNGFGHNFVKVTAILV